MFVPHLTTSCKPGGRLLGVAIRALDVFVAVLGVTSVTATLSAQERPAVRILVAPKCSPSIAGLRGNPSRVPPGPAEAADPCTLQAVDADAERRPPQEHAPPPAGEQREYPTLHISGFGDVNYTATHKLEGSRGFSEGQFALHLTSELSPRVTFFGEISFSARADAGTDSPPVTGFNAEIERSIIRFDRSDWLKVSFGRYHTPINYWNTAFHHGQWLQTTIARPEMIQFGGRFLPVHFVGGLVEGSVPAAGWNVNYKAGVGNGRASVISRAGDAGDSNNNRAWLLNGFVKPDRAFGLQAGGSLYVDKITLSSGRDFGEHIVAGHVAWQREDPELIAEFAGVRHRELPSVQAEWSHAFYIQAAYRLPWNRRLWKPYYRFERIDIDRADAVFQTVPNLEGSTLGMRYDLSMYAAVKGEYRNWRRSPGSPRNYGGFFQICFTF